MFQEHSLFPHLNVEENVGFSCKNKTRVGELLEILGISHLALKKTHQISGAKGSGWHLPRPWGLTRRYCFLTNLFRPWIRSHGLDCARS